MRAFLWLALILTGPMMTKVYLIDQLKSAAWQSIRLELDQDYKLAKLVNELGIEPLSAENSTRSHPTFRANLHISCEKDGQLRKRRANPSGMRRPVFLTWVRRAVTASCR